MAGKGTRLSKIAREFNVGISTIVEFLNKKGYEVDPNPNTKVTEEIYDILIHEYSADISVKKESDLLSLKNLRDKKETISINDIDQQKPSQVDVEEEFFIKDSSATAKIDLPDIEEIEVKVVGKVDLDAVSGRGKKKEEVPEKLVEEPSKEEAPDKEKTAKKDTKPVKEKEDKGADVDVKVVGKIDLETPKKKTTATKKTKKSEPEEKAAKAEGPAEVVEPAVEEVKEKVAKKEVEDENFIKTEIKKITGPSVVGKIELPPAEDREKKAADKAALKKKRKRIKKDTERVDLGQKGKKEATDKSAAQKKPALKKRRKPLKPEVSEEDVQKQVKETLARLTDRTKSKGAKYRREKREAVSQKLQEEAIKQEKDSSWMRRHLLLYQMNSSTRSNLSAWKYRKPSQKTMMIPKNWNQGHPSLRSWGMLIMERRNYWIMFGVLMW